MPAVCDVAVIGAGPYGLSIAAQLAESGVKNRIFGVPMKTWATTAPADLQMKSDGFGISLYDRRGAFTFGAFCRERGIPYADLGLPPRVGDFVAYGREFQKRFVPHLEEVEVVGLMQRDGVFELTLSAGAPCIARAVVVAPGVMQFGSVPKVFEDLPAGRVFHTAQTGDLAAFAGKHVAVVGSGSSAADTAGLLHERGANVVLIARGAMVPFYTKMRLPRTMYERLRWPMSPLGASWRSVAYARLPLLFSKMALEKRVSIVKTYLGPSAAYFMRDKVIGRVRIELGLETTAAAMTDDGKVRLTLANNGGETRTLDVDHVICGTGYKPALGRLAFLDPKLRAAVAAHDDKPLLNAHFESSVPGLFFVGALAADTFGPLLRFACGAEFAARRISKQFRRRSWRRRAVAPQTHAAGRHAAAQG